MKSIFKTYYFSILLICFIGCSSQSKDDGESKNQNEKTEYVIQGRLMNMIQKEVFLDKYYGNETTRINSVPVNPDGSFVFKLSGETPVGFYKITLDPMQSFEIIFNKANISFTGDASNVKQSIRFLNSIDNQLIHTYLNDRGRYNMQLRKFAQLEKTEEIKRKQFQMETSFYNYLNRLISEHQGTYASKIIAIGQRPHSPDFEKNYFSKEGEGLEKQYVRKHYFDQVDFMDESLIRGPILYQKIKDFFAEFMEEATNEKMQQAITEIMNKAGADNNINDFVLKSIYEFVETLENFDVISWISERHPFSDACDDDVNTDMTETLEILKKLAIGKPAMDFQLSDENGNQHKLYDINAKYTLLIFWSIGCEHCIAMIPRLKPVYDKYKSAGFEIITISKDPQSDFWRNMVKKAQFNWIDLNDPRGDNSPVKKNYHVTQTPKIFLLDEEKTFAAKLYDYDGIVAELEKKFGY